HHQTPTPPHPQHEVQQAQGRHEETHQNPTTPTHTQTPHTQRRVILEHEKRAAGACSPRTQQRVRPTTRNPSKSLRQRQVFNDVPPMSNHRTHTRHPHGHTTTHPGCAVFCDAP